MLKKKIPVEGWGRVGNRGLARLDDSSLNDEDFFMKYQSDFVIK